MANTSKTAFPTPPDAPRPTDLLAWYDAHARKLPWRSHGGRAPSPYHTWLSEIMLQQTTVATVQAYYHRFTTRWPDVAKLAAADEDAVLGEWAGLGYYSRARNLLKCAHLIVRDHGGSFPDDVKTLLTLPGIGDYTANAIRAIAFDLPANVVDGNVERVMARVFAYVEPINTPKGRQALRSLAGQVAPQNRPGDYAQAVMDLGATICTPRKPACAICPWRGNCRAFAAGLTQDLPRVLRKAKIPGRHAAMFAMFDDEGRIFLKKQPPTGLLGGLWMLPSTPWDRAQDDLFDPMPARHAPLPLTRFTAINPPVIHVFTHFRFIMQVYLCKTPVMPPDVSMEGQWFAMDTLPALPTVAKKLLDAVRMALGQGK